MTRQINIGLTVATTVATVVCLATGITGNRIGFEAAVSHGVMGIYELSYFAGLGFS